MLSGAGALRVVCVFLPFSDTSHLSCWTKLPGNINQLVLKLDSYCKELKDKGGVIAEFVNPKYADASRTTFKSSTRLECMMQARKEREVELRGVGRGLACHGRGLGLQWTASRRPATLCAS